MQILMDFGLRCKKGLGWRRLDPYFCSEQFFQTPVHRVHISIGTQSGLVEAVPFFLQIKAKEKLVELDEETKPGGTPCLWVASVA